MKLRQANKVIKVYMLNKFVVHDSSLAQTYRQVVPKFANQDHFVAEINRTRPRLS